MSRRGIAFAALAASACISAYGADTSTAILDPAFKTLRVEVTGSPDAPPVIFAGGPEAITVSFDELASDRSYLRYSLTHCDAQWQPSRITESEYIDGFNVADIDDYSFSEATTVPYVHYTFTIGDNREGSLQPTLSGNYMISIYRDGATPDEPVIRCRFSVAEASAPVEAEVTGRTDTDIYGASQQLNFTVDTRRAGVSNPYNDLIVTVTQNGREDNRVTLTTPQRVSGDKVHYEHLRPLIFPGGSEYRRFETVSVNYPSMRVEEVAFADPLYHARISTDYPRSSETYNYDLSRAGRFVIREYDSATPETGADYVMTHFTLEMPELKDASVFIDGDFTQRRFTPESRMHYDRGTSTYRLATLLKQGAYSYQYLVVPNGAPTGLTAPVEGDHHQTRNEYYIGVYHRPPGARYDRMIGFTTIKL